MEQFTILRDLGCALGQGYLFARPLSPEDAFRALADEKKNTGIESRG